LQHVQYLVDIQVYERAMEVYGSEEEMEKAQLKKVERREKQQQKKFDKNVQGNGLQIWHDLEQAQMCIFPGTDDIFYVDVRIKRCVLQF